MSRSVFEKPIESVCSCSGEFPISMGSKRCTIYNVIKIMCMWMGMVECNVCLILNKKKIDIQDSITSLVSSKHADSNVCTHYR